MPLSLRQRRRAGPECSELVGLRILDSLVIRSARIRSVRRSVPPTVEAGRCPSRLACACGSHHRGPRHPRRLCHNMERQWRAHRCRTCRSASKTCWGPGGNCVDSDSARPVSASRTVALDSARSCSSTLCRSCEVRLICWISRWTACSVRCACCAFNVQAVRPLCRPRHTK